MQEGMQAAGDGRAKFLIGGLLIVAAVIYLIASSTQAAAQYYMTIDELIAKGESVRDRDLKIAGAIIGDSIEYDAQNLTLRFTMANVPADPDEIEAAGGLAEVLHRAVEDESSSRLEVVYIGPMPDLMRHEAQAIVTGRLGEDGNPDHLPGRALQRGRGILWRTEASASLCRERPAGQAAHLAAANAGLAGAHHFARDRSL